MEGAEVNILVLLFLSWDILLLGFLLLLGVCLHAEFILFGGFRMEVFVVVIVTELQLSLLCHFQIKLFRGIALINNSKKSQQIEIIRASFKIYLTQIITLNAPINRQTNSFGIITFGSNHFRSAMLLVNEKKIKLEKTYQKVLNLYNALNYSYCFLGMRGHRQDCVVHFDADGKILFEHVFEKIMDAFGMMNEREAIMLETRENCITILDLEKHQFMRVPFQFLNEETDQSFIHTFADSKLLCIRENGRYNDNRFKLSYFSYPLKNDAKPIVTFYSEEHWTYEYLVRKANNHSQFCWYKGRHDENWEFFVFDLKENPKGEVKKYTYPNKVGQPYGMNKIQCALKTMWEIRPYQYMLVCDTDRTKPKDKPINNNYVVDVRTGHVREAKFDFGNRQQFLIDQKPMGPTSMFRTFDFQAGLPLETPVYYINNETEEIVAEETWKCSYMFKYEFPGYDGGMIIEGQFENGDVSEVTVSSKKVMNPKEIYLHFMLDMNPDFDSDLLQTVVEMIDYSK